MKPKSSVEQPAWDIVQRIRRLREARYHVGLAARRFGPRSAFRQVTERNPELRELPSDPTKLDAEEQITKDLLLQIFRSGQLETYPDSFWRHLRSAANELRDDALKQSLSRRRRRGD